MSLSAYLVTAREIHLCNYCRNDVIMECVLLYSSGNKITTASWVWLYWPFLHEVWLSLAQGLWSDLYLSSEPSSAPGGCVLLGQWQLSQCLLVVCCHSRSCQGIAMWSGDRFSGAKNGLQCCFQCPSCESLRWCVEAPDLCDLVHH